MTTNNLTYIQKIMTNHEIEKQAHELVISNKELWSDATAYVTEKVAFNMRNLWRQCRKNYWGVFDKPIDPQTGKKKIWSPLTFTAVEATVKNIDMDSKDVRFKARKEGRQTLKRIVQAFTQNKLEEDNLDDMLDKWERQLAIDGTIVAKVQEDSFGNTHLGNVDLLNFFIDPTSESIEKTEAVIERIVMTPEEVKGMKGWKDTEGLMGQENIERTGDSISKTSSKMKYVEIYIWEGLAKEAFMTGNEDDKDNIPLRIIISGKDTGTEKSNSSRVHLIEKLKIDKKTGKPIKSYEECWYTRVQGRWAGIGQAERLIMMQSYQNIILNVRKTRNEIASLGLFKIKSGRGITPQQLKRLPSSGAIKVKEMDDIEQFVIQEATTVSYKDEEVAQTWGERLTSTFETATGETMAATTTATVGAIQSESAAKSFVMVKKQIGTWLTRILKRHYLPKIGKELNKQEIIRLSMSGQELIEFDKEIIEIKVNRKLSDGTLTSEEDIEKFRQEELRKLETAGGERFIPRSGTIDIMEYDLDIYVDNAKINRVVLITELLQMIPQAPEYRQQILEQTFDLLGLSVRPQQPQMPEQGGQVKQPQSSTDQLTNAITNGKRTA